MYGFGTKTSSRMWQSDTKNLTISKTDSTFDISNSLYLLQKMDLREKLKVYESLRRIEQKVSPQSLKEDFGQWVSGKEVKNEFGSFFLSETRIDENYLHGNVSLFHGDKIHSLVYAWAGKDEGLGNLTLKNAVFLDTETTGLAGGTGIVPFLVGIGYFGGHEFIIEQYFIRDYHEEKAMLAALSNRLSQFNAMVTFNGKSYDINLLTSRFIIHKLITHINQIPHFDLLFAVRRLYKRRLTDCSLNNIEDKIFGLHRIDDVPGYAIPGMYFEYLQTGQGNRLISVFMHNRLDVISLAALAAHIGNVYQQPDNHLIHELDWYSLGRSFEAIELLEQAIDCYETALQRANTTHFEMEIRRSLSMAYKRSNQWTKAIEHWKILVQNGPYQSYPYEELAKFYEHHQQDYRIAIAWVDRALEQVDLILQLKHCDHLLDEKKELQYRKQRLMRKIGNDEFYG